MADIDFDSLSLTEFIKLKETIGREINARFKRGMALVFSDVVGSTAYFERFGAATGQGLLQRHLDLLNSVIPGESGRIVDTAGDGAFLVFENATISAVAMQQLQNQVAKDNSGVGADHQLSIRVGIHWGNVLTDGEIVTGDGVNLAARISESADVGEIRMSADAFNTLVPMLRTRCKALPAIQAKGIPEPVEVFQLEWRDPTLFPTRIRIVETDTDIELPSMDRVRFGRLETHDGQMANEVVLRPADPTMATRIGRWHFELLRKHDGYWLVSSSKAPIEVNGDPVEMGKEVKVGPGTEISVGGVVTILLLSDETEMPAETVVHE